MNVNSISQRVGKGARTFVRDMSKSDAFLPIVLLEAAVVTGRTYQAYKRGGFIEARERGTEESLGSVFWLGGVAAFNKLGDVIGQKVLKLKTADFEVGKDAVRNPIKNFLKQFPQHSESALAAFKFTKIISSILLANTFMGFLVPKFNQAITRRYQKSIKAVDNKKNDSQNNKTGLNQFLDKSNKAGKKNPSFGGFNPQRLFSLTQNFENDAKYKLLSTDVGTVSGRSINARNKYERREILFRDIASMYFYYFCKTHMNSLFNLVQTGRTTRLDTISAKLLDTHLQDNLKSKSAYSVEEFEKIVFGDKKTEIPSKIQSKFNNGIITIEELKNLVDMRTNKAIFERAEKMSALQPKVGGKAILTVEQLKDVYANGLIDNPKFLNGVFEAYTNKKSTNPFMFVAEKDLRSIKQQMADYVDDIIKKAKTNGENITVDMLKKANKKNFTANAMNLGAGFVLAAYFLSTAIPKMQYWITKKQTGEDKFPGVEKY